MFWIVLIIMFAVFATVLDSMLGKIVIGAAVTAIGLLLLYWITGLSFFIILAKICAIITVVTIVGAILRGIFG